ncbi:hypothetical protein [Endozoicomonas sp. 8E]|uniref:hypothetical protein n=1 Tax=Endozoicomonas sp. 8E TaxID=3035692 RepID=UPI0029393532|nr:hypothetical protein [Endozoicomonas sp. 8E]WOG30125.1 hypothetical protein P6910_10860 [Endozoicomonas sp. 8E]
MGMSAWFHGVYEYLVRRTKPVKSFISIGVACKFSSGNFYALQSVQQVQVLLKLLCNNQHCPRQQGCRANKYRQRDGSLRSPPLLPALGAPSIPPGSFPKKGCFKERRMSKSDISKYTSDELDTEKLSELISKRESFKIVAVKDISFSVNKIEGAIEKKGLKCRVYTENRSAAMAGMAIPTGVTQIAGLFSAVGIAAHNLATFNPDYEIAKNKLGGTITVKYKNE